jgi:hypothetical protein
LTITNPEGLTAYGPIAKLEEKFYKEYKMPLFPTPTIHGLKLVFSTEQSCEVWEILGQSSSLSMTNVIPLPSWWHLPSDAVTSALALLLTLFGEDPVATVQELVHSRVEIRHPQISPDDTMVEVFGFSAGSYTGMLVYRLLVEKGSALGCAFHHGTLGGITFHPIMFYDFCLHDGSSPLASSRSFKISQGTLMRRPTLIHCAEDQLCLWRPSDEEAKGVRALGYRLLLNKLKDHLHKAKPFGNCHHNYSMLLTAVSSGNISSLENLGIPQLFELADFSTNGKRFFGTILSIIGIISIDSLGSFFITLACRGSLDLPPQPQIFHAPLAIKP